MHKSISVFWLLVAVVVITLSLSAAVTAAPNFTRNGQPFFPICVYDYPRYGWTTNPESWDFDSSHLAEMVDAGINTIIASDNVNLTAAKLDTCQQYGMAVIASVWAWEINPDWRLNHNWIGNPNYHVNGSEFDLKIQEIKNKPALWMYENQDEAAWNLQNNPCHGLIPDYNSVMAGVNFLRSKDPNHQIWYCEAAYGWSRQDPPCPDITLTMSVCQTWQNIADSYGQDSYPCSTTNSWPTANIAAIGDLVSPCRTIVSDNKPIAMVLQGFSDATHRRPVYEETRFMAYDTIIRGAKGVFWFGTSDIEPDSQLWADIKSVAKELRLISPALLASDATGVTLGDANLEAYYKNFNGARYLIVANKSSNTLNNKSITASGFNVARNGNKVMVLFENNRTISTSTTTWYDSFGPWAVHVYSDKCTPPNDFDGDGCTDAVTYNPETGDVKVVYSGSGFATSKTYVTTLVNGIPAYGDYDGDGLGDICIYMPASGWFNMLTSGTGYNHWFYYLTAPDQTPVSGDWDNDKKSDICTYAQNDANGWFNVRTSSSGFANSLYYGTAPGYVPVSYGDWDNDGGKTDICLYGPWNGYFNVLTSSSNYASWWYFGSAAYNTPVIGDWDLDRISDVCIYTPGNGFFNVLRSSSGFSAWWYFGTTVTNQIPTTGDWDGDGKTDNCLVNGLTGFFNIQTSTSGYSSWWFPNTQTANIVPFGGYAVKMRGKCSRGTTPISGAIVTARNTSTQATYSSTTGSDGLYNIEPSGELPPGTYRLSVNAPAGYNDIAEGGNIIMTWGRAYVQNFTGL